MPHPFDQMPETNVDRQFPGGDINERQETTARELFSELTDGDEQVQIVQLGNLRRGEIAKWRSMHQQEPIYQSMRSVARTWGRTYLGDIEYRPDNENRVIGQGNRIVAAGAFGMFAFAKKSHLLTSDLSPNLADELREIEQFDREQILRFAHNAWLLMHDSHPRLHHTIAPFALHISTLFHLEDSRDEFVLLSAATALPYLLATTSRMDVYLNRAIEDQMVDRTITRLRAT
jgi:hypothetical protein